ncbi:MAG: hypothetical protein AAGJ52_09370, partial [Pseudomonadota bacterium]
PESTPFNEATVPGRYAVADFFGRLYLGFPFGNNGAFTFDLEPGGTGSVGSLLDPNNPNPAGSAAVVWEVNARGEIEIRRELATVPPQYQYRSWTLLRTAGQDVVILEVGPTQFTENPDFEVPFEPGRINVYRKFPLP